MFRYDSRAAPEPPIVPTPSASADIIAVFKAIVNDYAAYGFELPADLPILLRAIVECGKYTAMQTRWNIQYQASKAK